MPSERSQILNLFAAGRIDILQAERLLHLVGNRDRFLSLALVVMLLGAIGLRLPWPHSGGSFCSSLHSAAQNVSESPGFLQCRLFVNRFLGELP